MNIGAYAVEQIDVGHRLRVLDPVKVDELRVSVKKSGLLEPIGLTIETDGRRELVFGAHRLAAWRLERPGAPIEFVERHGTPDELRLMEIDENLYRHELTAGDLAEFLHERSEIWQRINGPFQVGRRAAAMSADRLQLSFFKDLNAKFGLSKHVVKKAFARRNAVTPEAWRSMRGTELTKKAATIQSIGRLTPAHQIAVVRAFCDDGVRPLASAIAQVTRAPKPAPASFFDRVVRRWPSLDAAEQRKIKVWIGKQAIGAEP